MLRSLRRALAPVLVLAVVLVAASPAAAVQAAASEALGRPYWHVFAAYAIAWVLVLGWVVSIARRLSRIEKRLED